MMTAPKAPLPPFLRDGAKEGFLLQTLMIQCPAWCCFLSAGQETIGNRAIGEVPAAGEHRMVVLEYLA